MKLNMNLASKWSVMGMKGAVFITTFWEDSLPPMPVHYPVLVCVDQELSGPY